MYQDQVDPHSHGLADLGRLKAVLAMPEARLGGSYSHRDIFEMASAYLFHIAHNQPFPRGNLKMAVLASIYFLYLHGLNLECRPEDLAHLVRKVADNRSSKGAVAEFLRLHAITDTRI